MTRRDELIFQLTESQPCDIAIAIAIDGATDLGVALVESHDFAKGTSSRATRSIVVARESLCGDVALRVPKTADGRVLFAAPWLGKVILGTTSIPPRHDLAREHQPFKEEIEFTLALVCAICAGHRHAQLVLNHRFTF